MKKLILIYNPVSGKAIFKHRLDEVIEKFQTLNCVIIPYRTKPLNEDLGDFIREINPDGLIAAGGDGTLHEVINLVMKEKIHLPIGIIGSGTSNDFATFLNLDTDDYFKRIAEGVTRQIDIGKANDIYFIDVASAGAATSIAHNVDVRLKNALGKLAYYIQGLTTLKQFKPINLHVKSDTIDIDVNAFLFLVVNSKAVASFKNVASLAEIDDGQLDMVIVKYCSMATILSTIKELVAGKNVSDQKNLLFLQSSKYEISCDEDIESDIDGERGPRLPLKIETLHKAIEIFC